MKLRSLLVGFGFFSVLHISHTSFGLVPCANWLTAEVQADPERFIRKLEARLEPGGFLVSPYQVSDCDYERSNALISYQRRLADTPFVTYSNTATLGAMVTDSVQAGLSPNQLRRAQRLFDLFYCTLTGGPPPVS